MPSDPAMTAAGGVPSGLDRPTGGFDDGPSRIESADAGPSRIEAADPGPSLLPELDLAPAVPLTAAGAEAAVTDAPARSDPPTRSVPARRASDSLTTTRPDPVVRPRTRGRPGFPPTTRLEPAPEREPAPEPRRELELRTGPPTTRLGRLGARVRSWPAWPLHPIGIYLASRALTWTTLAITSIFTRVGVGGEIDRWDSRWFIRAAEFGWPSQLPQHNGHVAANTIAFLPAFPLSFRWLSHLTGLSLLSAGALVTSVSGLTAMIGVWLLIRAYADERAADRGTLLLAMFPGSFVLSMVYSEGLVLTFVAFGLLALMRRRWLLAGVLGMLATATTPIALAFEVSCLWCAYREVASNRKWRALLAPVVTPLGFFTYQVWLWFHTGNVSAWRLTQRGGWKSYPSLVYAAHTVGVFLKDPIATNKTDDLLFVGTVLTVFAAVIAIRSRLPMPVLLYGLVAAGIALVSAPVGLRPRFMFLAFPLIVAVGTWLRGRAYVWVVSASMALLVFATAYEVSSWAVFP